jgi:transcription-repair coupling factor (superfamily II helicase)
LRKSLRPRSVPSLIPDSFQLPAAGAQTTLEFGAGSSDAQLLAQLIGQCIQAKRLLLCVVANPADANRLIEELGWFSPDSKVALLSDWETLPYDTFSPHVDLISERLSTLWRLQRGELDAVIVSASTALQKIAPPSYLAGHSFAFKKKQRVAENLLRDQLVTAGYEHVSQVVKPGEYSVRGSLIDLYPMGATLPFRLDLFGDVLESIRTFDPDTQRTLYAVDSIALLPGREFPTDEEARVKFRGRWRDYFEGDPSRSIVYKDIGNGIFSAGIEYYLPLFFDQAASLFDYVPEQALVVSLGSLQEAFDGFLDDARGRFRFMGKDSERPLMAPQDIFLSDEGFFAQANSRGRLSLKRAAVPTNTLPDVAIERRAQDPVISLRAWVNSAASRTVLISESAGRTETLLQYLNELGIKPHSVSDWQGAQSAEANLMLLTAPLYEGFMAALPDGSQLALVTEGELFGGNAKRSRRASRGVQTNVDAIIRDLSELRIGDPVVHVQHGVGRYQGLISLDIGDGETEFLHLSYAAQAKLYVPVSQLHVITRYSGAGGDDAPLHSLGSGQWDKAKRKAAEQARDTAAELLNLYARRAARVGHSFKFSARDYEAFSASFAFEETPDQLAAIHATIQDMISDKPMDRLVCGDVGFGKTEVALRAAFIAIADGKQVAVLCPTTLLAEQHFQTFKDRFADWPVKIAELSRFRNAKEIAASIEGIASGQIDIVVGTHKLFSKDVKFNRLGLSIIDEEHRFGVRHKEALKAMRAEVDILTLTATPIPRTLAMSLEGLRDFSVIATAPQKRLAIKTFVRRESDGAIREALLRELKRGGQCYFLHNEVDTIQNRKLMLEKLVPEARIAVAHGQMPERELERVMRDFTTQRFNVLLCTTIVETGIDVPTANTIVMHRADKFGLAQLHQLRGRVGRSHHQAYAYLLVPDEGAITKDATKRLEAIQAMEELGSGFFLAMHDLEIRGAGEVLGESQSGEVIQVGFQMYNDMINEAVKAMKSGREPDLSAPLAAVTEINLHTPALLPTDYCPDVNERLTLYKRLANANNEDDLIRMQEELIDRFGKCPPAANALIETHRLRIRCTGLGITKIDAAPDAMIVQFSNNTSVPAERIIQYMQSVRDVRFAGQDKLRFTLNDADVETRLQRLKGMMTFVAPKASVPVPVVAKKIKT